MMQPHWCEIHPRDFTAELGGPRQDIAHVEMAPGEEWARRLAMAGLQLAWNLV